MALTFPYTYISCPCSDVSSRARAFPKRLSRQVEEQLEVEEPSLDPHSARAKFSLFPPTHLYYCEDCHDLKCPRCVTEEIICWYCPQCLCETAPSAVKSASHLNRCDGNCFSCPICQGQCVTSPINSRTSKGTEYILSCNYCMWSSLESGVSFKDGRGIRKQMEKRLAGERGAGHSRVATQDLLGKPERASFLSREYNRDDSRSEVEEAGAETASPLSPTARYEALKSFYKEQLIDSDTNSSSNFDFSPSSLTRLMSLYSTTGSTTSTSVLQSKRKPKTTTMREACTAPEGLQVTTPVAPPENLASTPFQYDLIPTPAQLANQHPSPLGSPLARHISELLPLPTLLTTKRAKRCSTCTHILVKPELKITSTRYRIKLMALNTIPTISVRPVPVSGGLLPAGIDGHESVELDPGKPNQWIVTFRNPLFEEVEVSLGCPGTAPGRLGHRVTVLCPQFSIGKNGDGWDDALNPGSTAGVPKSDTNVSLSGFGGEQIAGKVYDRGRNWTSVVFEIVPVGVALRPGERLEKDDDVIEIPVRIRLNWKVSDEQVLQANRGARASSVDTDGDKAASTLDGADDGSREVAYWTVLGIGRVKT